MYTLEKIGGLWAAVAGGRVHFSRLQKRAVADWITANGGLLPKPKAPANRPAKTRRRNP